jgi:methylphosphotriester-DNA--protein-cysteine methyltransferase
MYFSNAASPLNVEIGFRNTESARILSVWGDPARVFRGPRQHLLFSERGVTVGSWIRSRRLAQSRIELSNFREDRTITEIAMMWGFSDAAHFSRSFKAAFGISPNAFRRATASRSGDLRPCTVLQKHCVHVQ